MWKRGSIGVTYPEWEGGAHGANENRGLLMLSDHRENWGPLEEVGEFPKELAMNAWREDGFD